MTRTSSIAAAVVILVFAIAVNGYLSVTASHRSSDASARIGSIQHEILVSQKASTKTRVVTVGSRCDLTHLILGVLVRVHDTADSPPFVVSYQTCVKQLANVKHIDADTPNP